MNFQNIEAWAVAEESHSSNLFVVAALLGFEGQWVRLSAKDQKRIMGSNVFGKQEIRVNEDGTVDVRRSICFGTDFEQCQYDGYKVQYAVNNALKISPAVYGKGMYNGVV